MSKKYCFWCDNVVEKEGQLCPKCQEKKKQRDRELEQIDKEYKELFGNLDCIGMIKLFKDKNQKIADLEEKLAKRDKTIDEINKEYLSAIKDWKQLVEIEKAENAHLKQQLAEKDEELKREKENTEMWASWKETYYKKLQQVKQQLAEKEKELKYKTAECEKWKTDYKNCSELEKIMSKEHQYCLDNWRASEQDKISFAVEQLEKVKEFCNQREKDFTYLRDEIKAISHNKWVDYIEELRFIKTHIGNQINELKEMK